MSLDTFGNSTLTLTGIATKELDSLRAQLTKAGKILYPQRRLPYLTSYYTGNCSLLLINNKTSLLGRIFPSNENNCDVICYLSEIVTKENECVWQTYANLAISGSLYQYRAGVDRRISLKNEQNDSVRTARASESPEEAIAMLEEIYKQRSAHGGFVSRVRSKKTGNFFFLTTVNRSSDNEILYNAVEAMSKARDANFKFAPKEFGLVEVGSFKIGVLMPDYGVPTTAVPANVIKDEKYLMHFIKDVIDAVNEMTDDAKH